MAAFSTPPSIAPETPKTLSDDVRAELERRGESPDAVLAWPALAEVLEAIEQDPARMARAAAMLAEGREGIEQPIPVRSMLRSLERAALARYTAKGGWVLTERGRVVASFVEATLARGERRTEPPEPGPQLVVQGPRGDR